MENKILYVDDEPAWIRTVGLFLKLAGFRVVTAGDAKQAILQAEGGSLGAIVLDVNLRGEDTAQLLRCLKEKQPQAKVILYTGQEQHEEAVQSLMAQGAEKYLRKGNLKDLANCLKEISLEFGVIKHGPRLAPVGAWQTV